MPSDDKYRLQNSLTSLPTYHLPTYSITLSMRTHTLIYLHTSSLTLQCVHSPTQAHSPSSSLTFPLVHSSTQTHWPASSLILPLVHSLSRTSSLTLPFVNSPTQIHTPTSSLAVPFEEYTHPLNLTHPPAPLLSHSYSPTRAHTPTCSLTLSFVHSPIHTHSPAPLLSHLYTHPLRLTAPLLSHSESTLTHSEAQQ